MDPERVQVAADEQALPLALLVEGAFSIDGRVGAARTGTSVAQDIQIHAGANPSMP